MPIFKDTCQCLHLRTHVSAYIQGHMSVPMFKDTCQGLYLRTCGPHALPQVREVLESARTPVAACCSRGAADMRYQLLTCFTGCTCTYTSARGAIERTHACNACCSRGAAEARLQRLLQQKRCCTCTYTGARGAIERTHACCSRGAADVRY